MKGDDIMGTLQDYLKELMSVKENVKYYKDLEKDLISTTKKLLDEEGISKDVIDDIKVNYQDVVKSTLDNEELIKILQELSQDNTDIKKCLIPTFKVDEEELERLVYEGIIDPQDLQPAYREKVTKTLKISRVKK